MEASGGEEIDDEIPQIKQTNKQTNKEDETLCVLRAFAEPTPKPPPPRAPTRWKWVSDTFGRILETNELQMDVPADAGLDEGL